MEKWIFNQNTGNLFNLENVKRINFDIITYMRERNRDFYLEFMIEWENQDGSNEIITFELDKSITDWFKNIKPGVNAKEEDWFDLVDKHILRLVNIVVKQFVESKMLSVWDIIQLIKSETCRNLASIHELLK
jgi:hypothetical protein